MRVGSCMADSNWRSRFALPVDASGVEAVDGAPFIERRGLKFNIPLDIRTPSYQDAGDAAQNNIAEMWNFEFWREYLDAMARDRYNVLTLWNPHPFPSMIHLDDYPDVALEDVCGTSFPAGHRSRRRTRGGVHRRLRHFPAGPGQPDRAQAR